jgi:hypothetical protein
MPGGEEMKRNKADELFSQYIKFLSGGYCKRCGHYLGVKSRGLHCAHWQSRGKWTTRYERDNAQALCYGCHRYLDQHKEEKDEFFFNILGFQRGLEVMRLSDMTLKDLGVSKKELQERTEAHLKELLHGIKEVNDD